MMLKFNVVTDYCCGYFGGSSYVIEADTAREAKQEGMRRTRQEILDNPKIPDWVAKTTTMVAAAKEIK